MQACAVVSTLTAVVVGAECKHFFLFYSFFGVLTVNLFGLNRSSFRLEIVYFSIIDSSTLGFL